jgi:hypothetical protein
VLFIPGWYVVRCCCCGVMRATLPSVATVIQRIVPRINGFQWNRSTHLIPTLRFTWTSIVALALNSIIMWISTWSTCVRFCAMNQLHSVFYVTLIFMVCCMKHLFYGDGYCLCYMWTLWMILRVFYADLRVCPVPVEILDFLSVTDTELYTLTFCAYHLVLSPGFSPLPTWQTGAKFGRVWVTPAIFPQRSRTE